MLRSRPRCRRGASPCTSGLRCSKRIATLSAPTTSPTGTRSARPSVPLLARSGFLGGWFWRSIGHRERAGAEQPRTAEPTCGASSACSSSRSKRSRTTTGRIRQGRTHWHHGRRGSSTGPQRSANATSMAAQYRLAMVFMVPKLRVEPSKTALENWMTAAKGLCGDIVACSMGLPALQSTKDHHFYPGVVMVARAVMLGGRSSASAPTRHRDPR